MGRDLASRAEQARGQIEQQPQTLGQQIQAMQAQFQLAMPRGAEAGQLVRDAMTCLRTTKDLAKADAASVLGALMTCAQLGLRPGVGALGHAWILPFWDKNAGPERNGKPMGGHVAQLIIGYQGYAELAYRTGRVLNIAARTVYTNDHFELAYHLSTDDMVHRPYLDGPRGEARLYYAVARLKDDGYAVTDPMTHADMETHRDRFAMAKAKEWVGGKETGRRIVVGPWRDHFEAMAHKTMVRRLAKLLPKSTEFAYALAVDEGVRVDITPDVAPDEVTERPVIDGQVEPDAIEPPSGDSPPEPPAEGDGWPPVTKPGQGA
ncbi:recombination protein RecT [Spongiactinospora sp. TRM90649]|uniref:recombination protein RecT n=1 Tax=Spongiactinospora sp. TRM90649 TaxID=3031114 RepID=UPI0023F8D27F|nr:recombination protein RecT [Spongiactinospora sp. TRM90649]MDF5758563.1 recombination protein RecT [Spongiactinospora sp. TRM90649]